MSEERGERRWPPGAIHILSYLSRHPAATDTLEGIAEWWVLRETITQEVEETARALDFLVSLDLVIEEWTAGNRPRYRLNQKRLEEILELVRGLTQEREERR